MGEISHSDLQTALVVYARTQIPGFWSGVEVRVQVKADRFRIATDRYFDSACFPPLHGR